ncbi:lipocalin-like domain-containing protein [Nocardia sp. NPDC056541]|uniref:lipocalin-like domain-containing protein n=1 Tax=unclassified Nocardia TaxID=2637762 RepID=UPI00367361A1
MARPDDLIGTWQLASFHDTDPTGTPTPGPLGAEPAGFLTYTASGHLSVAMMRTAPGEPAFMGYAGRWSVDDGVLRHHILVCSRTDWVGEEQVRIAELTDGLLTIRTTPDNGRVVQWRRAEAAQEKHAIRR